MACGAMLGCLRLSVFNFSFLCCAVPELLDQTGHTGTGEPLPDLHACVQPEGDCHHSSAQGQNPSAPEELGVSHFLLLFHTGLWSNSDISANTCGITERGPRQAGDFLKSVFSPQNSPSRLTGGTAK